MKIKNIGFTVRVLNLFHKHSIRTGKDLLIRRMSELKELKGFGKGYAFVARQYHIRTDTKEFYIELVFYNLCLEMLRVAGPENNRTYPPGHWTNGYVRSSMGRSKKN